MNTEVKAEERLFIFVLKTLTYGAYTHTQTEGQSAECIIHNL